MTDLSRRELLAASAGILGGTALLSAAEHAAPLPHRPAGAARLKQSVSRWPYGSIPLPEFCRQASRLGLAGIDLLQPAEWPVAADAGLVCSMGYPADRDDFIATGFNDPANHRQLLTELERTIPLARQAGVPNVITMFGNRRGASDAEAIDHCIAGLSRIKPLAEEQQITVCVELLNSRIDHKGYQGDHTAFGVAVMQGIDSPRVRLLYDIYHMQIMEGDVIRTIRDNIGWIGHFHTGGVPDRHELDDHQELNYRGIAMALAELGFQGYLAHEFIPTRAPLQSLQDAVELCRV
ncbi:MAG: TIM barrel protein [Gemmatimonadota bacterium]